MVLAAEAVSTCSCNVPGSRNVETPGSCGPLPGAQAAAPVPDQPPVRGDSPTMNIFEQIILAISDALGSAAHVGSAASSALSVALGWF